MYSRMYNEQYVLNFSKLFWSILWIDPLSWEERTINANINGNVVTYIIMIKKFKSPGTKSSNKPTSKPIKPSQLSRPHNHMPTTLSAPRLNDFQPFRSIMIFVCCQSNTKRVAYPPSNSRLQPKNRAVILHQIYQKLDDSQVETIRQIQQDFGEDAVGLTSVNV